MEQARQFELAHRSERLPFAGLAEQGNCLTCIERKVSGPFWLR